MFKKYMEYVKDNPKGYWFKAKRFGWGWTPVKWQGWATILIYVALLIASTRMIDATAPKDAVPYAFLALIILWTAIFFAIAYKKGEKPSWHWGWPKK